MQGSWAVGNVSVVQVPSANAKKGTRCARIRARATLTITNSSFNIKREWNDQVNSQMEETNEPINGPPTVSRSELPTLGLGKHTFLYGHEEIYVSEPDDA